MDHKEIIPSLVLHWNYRGFTEFPIQQLQGEESEITDIYFKDNLISRLPNDICMLENLQSLYLSGNDITELPPEISKLRCLKCLDVSGNRLRCIPDEIGEVRCLKFLILDENELTVLPLRLAELRGLRYISVCDNKLKWLPQRPVYNYHHCEFRFWRNPSLQTLPYSLWYHMFRDQQTRSLNIGCLSTQTIPNDHSRQRGNHCRLKLNLSTKETNYDIYIPSEYNTILEPRRTIPPSLFELCKRQFYEMVVKAAKNLTMEPYSIYSYNNYNNETNNNVIDLETNFDDINLNNKENDTRDLNGNNCVGRSSTINIDNANKKIHKKRKSQYVPADLIEEYYSFLPIFVKENLCNGPISRCENVNCKTPVFDFAHYEFIIGKIILIDNTEDVILSAIFCSKTCADIWKRGKLNIIPWTLIKE